MADKDSDSGAGPKVQFAFAIEAPMLNYLAVRKTSNNRHEFFFSEDADQAICFGTEPEAFKIMMAVKLLAPSVFEYGSCGEAKTVDIGFVAEQADG